MNKTTSNVIQLSDRLAANTEKKIPRDWINEEGNYPNQKFIDYALPLIQGDCKAPLEDGLPRFARLKKILVKG